MSHDEFVDAVQKQLSFEDREQTADLAATVLKTFSELLYRTERDKLGAPLAKPLSRYLHAAKRQNNREETDRFSVEEFLNRIEARTEMNLSREEAHRYSSAVFAVLTEAVGKSLLTKVVEKLPRDYTSFFPFYEETEVSGAS